jgi:hypothetical protein
MPTLPAGWGRYFFIDGDAGDDAHDGFIDAPLGTIFTGPQAAAHAVKTTDRLEAVTPMLGNAQIIVRLWKPRAGGATYDKTVPGDGLGRCDRRQLYGYDSIIDRGSDLTNSLADRTILGGVATEGPFAVTSVVLKTVTFDPSVVLPGALDLMKRRLAISGIDGTFYASVRWGDFAPAPAANILNVWELAGTINPLTSAFLDQPGAKLYAFYEAAYRPSEFNLTAAGYETAGMQVTGTCQVGTATGLPARYTYFLATGSTTVVGSVIADTMFVDETSAQYASNPGLLSVGGIDGRKESALFENHFGLALVGGQVNSGTIAWDRCTIQSVSMRSAQLVTVENCQHDGLALYQRGHAEVITLARIPTGAPLQLFPEDPELNLPGDDAIPSYGLADLYELDGVSSGTHGVDLHWGQYRVTWNPGSRNAGTGFRVATNEVGGDEVTIEVSYASLSTTGFEVVGGVKLVVRKAGQGYLDDMLPCPRCKVARYASGEGDFDVPAGVVVRTQDANLLQLAIASGVFFPVPQAAGFAVTNSHIPEDGSGGLVLISTDTTGGVLNLESGSPYPDLGAPLYVSASDPGAVTAVPPKRGAGGQDVGPVTVGNVSPISYDDSAANRWILCAWMPGDQAAQLSQVTTGFDVASSAALADVPELYSYAFPKHAYKLRACVFVSAGAVGGSRVAVAGAFALDVCNFSYTFVGVIPGPALVQAAVRAAFGDVAGVVKENAGNGYWLIEGSFTPSAGGGGVVSVQFAQATSDVGRSTAEQGSYLEITEQK